MRFSCLSVQFFWWSWSPSIVCRELVGIIPLSICTSANMKTPSSSLGPSRLAHAGQGKILYWGLDAFFSRELFPRSSCCLKPFNGQTSSRSSPPVILDTASLTPFSSTFPSVSIHHSFSLRFLSFLALAQRGGLLPATAPSI